MVKGRSPIIVGGGPDPFVACLPFFPTIPGTLHTSIEIKSDQKSFIRFQLLHPSASIKQFFLKIDWREPSIAGQKFRQCLKIKMEANVPIPFIFEVL